MFYILKKIVEVSCKGVDDAVVGDDAHSSIPVIRDIERLSCWIVGQTRGGTEQGGSRWAAIA